MGTLNPSEIRSRVAEAISTALPSWSESRYAYDLFPGQDSRQLVHLGYAVGILRTDISESDRQRPTYGVLASTLVGVRFCFRVRGDNQQADYDAAMDAEVDLVAAVLTTGKMPDLSLRLSGVPSRRIIGDGTVYLGEIQCSVLHRYPLE